MNYQLLLYFPLTIHDSPLTGLELVVPSATDCNLPKCFRVLIRRTHMQQHLLRVLSSECATPYPNFIGTELHI